MKFARYLLFAGTLLALPLTTSAQQDLLERVDISGFGRVIGGYLDTDKAIFNGYNNSFSFDEESLIGIQADIELTQTLSFTTQLLAHSGEFRKSGIEWMYLTYRPTTNWQFRFGKQRTNYYSYADVLDVGFAYPWITPPNGVYNNFLLPSFEGINAQYSNSFGDLIYSVEGYWGSDETDLAINSDTVISPNINDMRGLILKYRWGHWSGSVSVNGADIKLPITDLQAFGNILSAAGFTRSAESLQTNGRIRLYHAGLKYEELDWFIESEYIATRADILAIPDIDGIALTALYNLYPYSLFATFSRFESDATRPVDEIPFGLSPEIDALAFGYREVFSSLIVGDSQFFTVGARRDLNSHFAVKVAATYIDTNQNRVGFFSIVDDEFDRNAMLYQVALEWVF